MVSRTRGDGAERADREHLIPHLGCVHYGDRPLKPEKGTGNPKHLKHLTLRAPWAAS